MTTTTDTRSRAELAAERDLSISRMALQLGRKKIWPSPESVADALGMSVSVIDKRKHLLTEGRRKWVERMGHDHPQWKDDEQSGERLPKPDPAPVDKERYKLRLARQRQKIRDHERREAELTELVRRLTIGVRPPEIKEILAAQPKQD